VAVCWPFGKAKTEKHYDQSQQKEGTAGYIFTFCGWIKADWNEVRN
jgi:hypothetical protein